MKPQAFPTERFRQLETPFYYYDTALLDQTLQAIRKETEAFPHWHVHYAVKACVNPYVLKHILAAGLGADCVSGGEIRTCLNAGFPAKDIVFAGVGKSDWEIELALNEGIQCFNVESIAELEVINEIAERMQQKARISLRINPDVGAHTHSNITTGLAENKFGIAMEDMEDVIRLTEQLSATEFVGLHFHIGSQILDMEDFVALCQRINELQDRLEADGIRSVRSINVGGGLGVDYNQPNEHPITDFHAYFQTYATHLKLRPGQELHFELGRAVVAQCGTLVARCLYVKKTKHKQFAILDAGMTELIRPALYGSLHQVENLTSTGELQTYDVVGPICESSDVFASNYQLKETKRGDLIALRSAGAYGEIMASGYNCRQLPPSYCSETIHDC